MSLSPKNTLWVSKPIQDTKEKELGKFSELSSGLFPGVDPDELSQRQKGGYCTNQRVSSMFGNL